MAQTPIPLTDQQVQTFIAQGFLLLDIGTDDPIHQAIYDKLDEVWNNEGNVGNNLLPKVPRIQQVFDHPKVRGALGGLLGPDYIMNPHRHGHRNAPGAAGMAWHKDCYVFDHNIRQPRFWWVLAFYFPQEVTLDMGPTGLQPGRHFVRSISDQDPAKSTEEALPICVPKGTVALVHFDAWHRAYPNTSDRQRFMLKFQFARMSSPASPQWDSQSPAWQPPSDLPAPAAALDVWRWLRGESEKTQPAAPTDGMADTVFSQLTRGPDDQRLEAAYRIGRFDHTVVPQVLKALRHEVSVEGDCFERKDAANPHGTNPHALFAAQTLLAMGSTNMHAWIDHLNDADWKVRVSLLNVLANLGPAAVKALPQLTFGLADEHWWVRRGAAEALGRIGQPAASAAGMLTQCLNDQDYRVRRMAALAIAQIGTGTHKTLQALAGMLEDTDRYNHFYAQLALRHLPDPEAAELLLDALSIARWCPLTTPASLY